MARQPTAVGKERKHVTIDIVFNGHSGDLPQRLQCFLTTNHSRGGTIVQDLERNLHYFRGDYTPGAAKEVKAWLRAQGVIFPRKRPDE